MGDAKRIDVRPISSQDAGRIVKSLHYSGKVVQNSQVHLGVFLDGRCGGAMQFGPSLDKRRIIGVVRDTKWNDFLELNRLAFADWLPRNSESRALGFAMRWLRKTYPWLKWVVSFADGAQCGDGAIYRASGFVLTGISDRGELVRLPSGEVVHRVALNTSMGKNVADARGGKYGREEWIKRTGGTAVEGCMFRYIFFIDPCYRERLTVPVIPFSEIERRGVGMYRGRPKVSGAESNPLDLGGETPTRPLQ